MTVAEYATRGELEGVDRRVEDLRRDLQNTERILRDRDEEKERSLRAEFVEAVRASEDRSHERFDKLDAHLERQDAYIMRRRFRFAKPRMDVLVLAVGTLAAMVFAHFLFGIG